MELGEVNPDKVFTSSGPDQTASQIYKNQMKQTLQNHLRLMTELEDKIQQLIDNPNTDSRPMILL